MILHDVCPPGIDAARYLNYHEDPGGLSLALGREAIASVQRVAIPVPDAYDDTWVRHAVIALGNATERATPPVDALSRLRRFQASPRALAGRELVEGFATRLPINLRQQFTSAAAFVDDSDLLRWARRTSGLMDLIENPVHVLALLDSQEGRQP